MIIGLLGFSKQVELTSLDPLIPTERLVFMLQDARASILTQQHLAERFEAAPLVCLDSDWDAIAQQPDENLLSAATPENLVYVVYLRLNRQPKGSLSSISNSSTIYTVFWKTRPERWFQFCNCFHLRCRPRQHCYLSSTVYRRMSSRNLARAGN